MNEQQFKPGDRVHDMENTEPFEVIEGPFHAYMVKSQAGVYTTVRADRLEPIPPVDPRVDLVAKAVAKRAFPDADLSDLTVQIQEEYRAVARVALTALEAETDGPLVHVGYYCWRGSGHWAATACRSDSVPIYVPRQWEKDMRGVLDDE